MRRSIGARDCARAHRQNLPTITNLPSAASIPRAYRLQKQEKTLDITNPPIGVKIARVAVLQTGGRPDLTPSIARVYEEIAGAPATTTMDLLTTPVTLGTHAAVAEVRRDLYSAQCRLGIERTITDTLALLAGRRASSDFELGQKVMTADLVIDQGATLHWALQASIRADARVLFPKSDRAEIEEWISAQRERASPN